MPRTKLALAAAHPTAPAAAAPRQRQRRYDRELRVAAAQSFTPDEVEALERLFLVLGDAEQITALADALIVYDHEEANLLDAILTRAAADGDVRSAVWEKSELLARTHAKLHRIRMLDEQLRILRIAAQDPQIIERLAKKTASMQSTIEKRREKRERATPPHAG